MPAMLYVRSFGVLTFLWAIVFALAMAVTFVLSIYLGDALTPQMIVLLPIIVALLIVGFQFLISPWIMDLMISWFFDATKYPVEALPVHIRDHLYEEMQQYNFSLKYVAIIHDNNPNAFTYGHTKKNARIVITEGILEYLDEDEQLAVISHECGHIIHRDFIWMTLAAAVPLICYSFFQGLIMLARSTAKDDDAAKIGILAAMVAVAAWIVYWISHFLVLLLSRVREYYADWHSAMVTEEPGALSRALVKIAYGMVRSDSERSAMMGEKDKHSAPARRRASRQQAFYHGARSMGIFDIYGARSLANSAYGRGSTELNEETVAAAASWDLSNPWGRFLELFSTHPLPAKRIRELNNLQVERGLPAEFPG
ncbi:MAG: M48 family metalloprotease, partial [Candidatus Hodarchaeales archaeon]